MFTKMTKLPFSNDLLISNSALLRFGKEISSFISVSFNLFSSDKRLMKTFFVPGQVSPPKHSSIIIFGWW